MSDSNRRRRLPIDLKSILVDHLSNIVFLVPGIEPEISLHKSEVIPFNYTRCEDICPHFYY